MNYIVYCTITIFLSASSLYCPDLRWNWAAINYQKIPHFDASFLFGCADSATQVEGTQTTGGRFVRNSWTLFEDERNLPFRVGKACERWTRYKEDFDLLVASGMHAYRFSIDWSKVEEQEGVISQTVLDHYEAVVDALLERNIVPMVTLFHHTTPAWFMQKGGFEHEHNIHHFVRFATRVYERLHAKVPFWLIFNEPVAYALEGYFRGNYPPGKKSLLLAGTVIWHQLKAHVETALAFRTVDPTPKIGIAHMCQPIDAYSRFNVLEHMMTKYFSYLLNETTIQFFKTGKFRWIQPWALGKDKRAPRTIDFIGINYYTHTTIKQTGLFNMQAMPRPDELLIATHDNIERSKVMYPEGLYRSIVRVSKLGLPIYITENGAPTDDVAVKTEFLQKHLYVIDRAIREGYDVRGYFYWTLVDCYAWTRGFANKHGIYAVDWQTQERTRRSATDYLLQVIAEHNKRYEIV